MKWIIDSTPRNDQFKMPGEFEDHERCWMIWPERPDNWRLGAKPAQKAFANVAAAISKFEPVTMCVSAAQYSNARRMLPVSVRLVEMSTNDSWMRDCGPVFVINRHNVIVRGIKWDFNSWGGLDGGLYYPWDKDDLVAQKVMDIEDLDGYKSGMVLEGGSIHVDGEGTLLTTEECLLNPNRNPKLKKVDIESKLHDYLSIEKIIWLDRGVFNDETSGHVDNLCAFIKPGIILLTWTDDKNDPQYEISHQAYELLRQTSDAMGRKLEVHTIHQPGPLFISAEESEGIDHIEGTLPRMEGDRMAASYVNFYVCNKGVIVPTFNDPHDQEALSKIQSLFPERVVSGVYAREILLGGGNIHCITQQQPSA